MAQIWQQNSALRSRYAQPTLMPTAQAVNTRVACEQLEQMARRLEAPQPAPPEVLSAPETLAAQPEPVQAEDVQPEPQAAAQPPAEPEWQPKTELEHRAAELMNWFDQMMGT